MTGYGTNEWRDYLLITLGTAVMAVATSSIYDPAGLVTGGFSGLAIVIKQLSQDAVRKRSSALGDRTLCEHSALFFLESA